MKFQLNNRSVRNEEVRIGEMRSSQQANGNFGGGTTGAVIGGVIGALNAMAGGSNTAAINPEYEQYRQMGEEIKAILTGVRESVRADAAPKRAVICPYCNASTVPDANGRCEYCGGSIQ